MNERIVVANLKHTCGKLHVVAPCCYGHGSAAQKDAFYAQLDQVTSSIRTGLILCLGDFNAVSGDDRSLAPHVIGPFCCGTPNDNTDRFLNYCISNGLRICGTWFRRPDIHRHTWYSNDGRAVKEIDHILVNARWNAIRQCRVYRSFEFDTGHMPVVVRMALKLKCVMTMSTLHPRYVMRIRQTGNISAIAATNPGIAKPSKKPWISQSSLALMVTAVDWCVLIDLKRLNEFR